MPIDNSEKLTLLTYINFYSMTKYDKNSFQKLNDSLRRMNFNIL